MLGDALTKDRAEAADLLRACVRARLRTNSLISHPRCNGFEKSVKPDPLRKPVAKLEVAGDERLTRTFLEGLTDVVPTESSTTAAEGRMRVRFLAKTVSSNLPLKQERAKVTLQLVVNTGNIQITTTTPLEDRMSRMLMDLERDCVKWMRGEPHMDMEIVRTRQPSDTFEGS